MKGSGFIHERPSLGPQAEKAERAARQQQKQKLVPKVVPPTTSEGSGSNQENQQQGGAEDQGAAGELQHEQQEEQVGSGGGGERGGIAHVIGTSPQQEGIGVVEAASTMTLNPEAAAAGAAGTTAMVEAAAAVAFDGVILPKDRTVPDAMSNSTGQSGPVIAPTSCSTSDGMSSAGAAAALGALKPPRLSVSGLSETWAISHESAAAGTSGAGSAAALSPAGADVGEAGPGSLSMGVFSPAAAPAGCGGSKPRRPKRIECVVCLDARAEVMLLPCKHTILCQACAELVREGGKTCPMCRTPVEGEVMVGGVVGVERREGKGPAAARGTVQQVVTAESVITKDHHPSVKQDQEGASRDDRNAASSSTSSRARHPDVSGSSSRIYSRAHLPDLNGSSSNSSITREAAALTSGPSFASGSIALPGVLQQLLANQLSPSRSNLSSDGVPQQRQQLQQFEAELPDTRAVSQRPVATQAISSLAAPPSFMSPGSSINPAVFLGPKSAITSVLGVPTAVASPAGSTALPLMPGLAGSDAAGFQSSLPAIAPAARPRPPTPIDSKYGRDSAAAVGPAVSIMGTNITSQGEQQACRAFMHEAASLLRQTEAQAFGLLAQTQLQLTEMMQEHRSEMRELCLLYGVAEEDTV